MAEAYRRLAEDIISMREDINSMCEDRKAFIEELKTFVKELHSNCQTDAKERDAEIRQRAEAVAESKAEVAKLIERFKREGRERAEAVTQLKAEVAKLIEGFKGEGRERAEAVAQLKAEVTELIEGFDKESAARAAAWQDLLVKVSGIARRRKPRKKVKVVEEKPVEEAVKEATLEEQVLSVIKAHPVGIKLVDIEKILGVARVKVGRITRQLMDAGEIKKEENLYFTA